MPEFDCTPAAIRSIDECRCLPCLSVTKLRQILMLELLNIMGYDLSDPDDFDEVMSESACFTCLSAKQRLEAVVCLIGNFSFDEGDTISTIADQAKCLPCMKPDQVEAIIMWFLCQMARFEYEPET